MSKLTKEDTMSNKKYTLIKSTKVAWNGTKLFQIKANISFGSVSKGDLGGYIEKEENLDTESDTWVFGDARVSGDAQVFGNAQVSGNAHVYGDTWVFGNAQVSGNAHVSGNAQVSGNAHVYGDTWVFGNAQVSGNAHVSGDAQVYGNAWVSGELKIIAGYLFGMRYNKEEIKYLENEGQEIIYKGELKLGEEETKKDDCSELVINGKKYKRVD
jgi:cytoskeletal protein CcmA (bactofilin family)